MKVFRINKPNGFHEVLSEQAAIDYCHANGITVVYEEIDLNPPEVLDARPVLTGAGFVKLLRNLFKNNTVIINIGLTEKTMPTLYTIDDEDVILKQTDIDDIIYVLRNQTNTILTEEQFNNLQGLVLVELNNYKL